MQTTLYAAGVVAGLNPILLDASITESEYWEGCLAGASLRERLNRGEEAVDFRPLEVHQDASILRIAEAIWLCSVEEEERPSIRMKEPEIEPDFETMIAESLYAEPMFEPIEPLRLCW